MRLSAVEREELKARAWEARMSVNAYVLDLLFPRGRPVRVVSPEMFDEALDAQAVSGDYVREPVYE